MIDEDGRVKLKVNCTLSNELSMNNVIEIECEEETDMGVLMQLCRNQFRKVLCDSGLFVDNHGLEVDQIHIELKVMDGQGNVSVQVMPIDNDPSSVVADFEEFLFLEGDEGLEGRLCVSFVVPNLSISVSNRGDGSDGRSGDVAMKGEDERGEDGKVAVRIAVNEAMSFEMFCEGTDYLEEVKRKAQMKLLELVECDNVSGLPVITGLKLADDQLLAGISLDDEGVALEDLMDEQDGSVKMIAKLEEKGGQQGYVLKTSNRVDTKEEGSLSELVTVAVVFADDDDKEVSPRFVEELGSAVHNVFLPSTVAGGLTVMQLMSMISTFVHIPDHEEREEVIQVIL
eukprot:TRINITY_DN2650_c0_g1_i1.p1 TRINITY_DN2650_c0_g1~~TRINITY_DN2650_c0_g1_i1.p1  ORF type:complete len:342 (+),score=120.67 TRINITY_DN2650_c0_g1_i1:767-1792(+)